MTQFFVPMIPPTVTSQEHKVRMCNGKPVFYNPPELKDAKAKLKAALSRHTPPVPYMSAVRLLVKWCFPLCGEHVDGEYRTSRPDTDNLNKLLKDCMTDCGFWKDDALVASEIIEKFWAANPGLFVYIEELCNGN